MLAVTHDLTGFAAGLGVGAAINAPFGVRITLAVVGLVASRVPDIDHPGSTVSRALPFVGRWLSRLVRSASKTVYAATKGPRDEPWSGAHRHLTHTLVFAVGFGAVVALGLTTAFTGTEWAPWARWVGVAAGAGCLAHSVGDSLTRMGCPFLWPIPIAGETWYEIKPLGPLSFRTGGPVEKLVVWPVFLALCVILMPGVWPLLRTVVSDLAR